MKQILIVIALLVGANSVHALNEQAFIKQLRSTHPFFVQQSLSSQIKQVEEQATKANEDWIIAVNSDYKNENASDVSSSAYDYLNTTSIGLSATKKDTDTGGDIIFKHTWQDKDKDIETAGNQFSIDYVYPLLRNKDGINDRLETDIAQIAIKQNSLERLEAEEAFVLEKLERFIDLAYAQEQQLINENRLALAEQELDLVNKKYDASVVDKVDVLLQQDAHQGAKQQLLQAQQDLILLRHEIAITLNLDFKKIVAQTDLYKTYNAKNFPLKTHLSTNARALKIKDLEQKSLKRQLRSFNNASQAKLDLNLGLTSKGENTHYSNSLNNQSTSWAVGLDLSYPLGGIESGSNIKTARLKLKRLAQYKQEQFLVLYTQAETLKKKINLLEQMLTSNQKQIKIAKARTVEEKKRYGNGNGQASFVINAQNNEQNVQLNYAQVAKNYQKAVFAFKATIDQLVK